MGLLTARPPRLRLDPALPPAAVLDHLLTVLPAADLRGRGGAAFPTATKISSAAGRRPVIIVNACDGEPLVAKDETLLRVSPGLVADGAALVARAVSARRVVIAAHTGSPAERSAHALLDAAATGLPEPGVLSVPRRYVASESTALASLYTGGTARPRYTERPLTQEDDAILVLNAETVAQVALLWAGHTGPLTRLVTVTGAVAVPTVLETTDEVPVGELVQRVGGASEPPRAVLVGGYAGTWLPWAEVAPYGMEALSRRGVAPGAGLLHVLGTDCPLTVVGDLLSYLAGQSAGQCGPCLFGLPAIAQDWSQLANPGRCVAAAARLQRRLPVVSGRGACRHPDGVVAMAASALPTFESHRLGHQHGRCDARMPVRVGAP